MTVILALLVGGALAAFGFLRVYGEEDAEVGDMRLGGDIRPVVPMRNATAALQKAEDRLNGKAKGSAK
jgi:hypothetical protein